MSKGALGLIEVRGYLSAIEAADTALKAANITLIGCEKVRGGIVTVKINGDVSAVTCAVDSAEAAVKKFNNFISSNVISRPDASLWKILENENSKLKSFENEELNKKEKIEDTHEEDTHKIEDKDKVKIEFQEEELELKTVEELRKLARSLSIGMTNKQIKFARKDRLIIELLNFCKKEDK